MFHHVGLVAQVLRFMKTFYPECHSEFAPCFQHCECWGWKLWNQPTGHIPKCVPQSWPCKPTFCPFSDPIPFTSLCHICLSQEWLWCSDSDSATAICCNQWVWQRKRHWRRHWCLLWKIKYRMMGKSCNIFSRGICWHQEGEGDQQTTYYFPKLSTIAISFRKWFQQQKTIHVLSLYNLSKPTYQETLYTTGFQFTFEVPPTLEYIWLLTI